MINMCVTAEFLSLLQGLRRCGDVRLLLPFSLHLLHCLQEGGGGGCLGGGVWSFLSGMSSHIISSLGGESVGNCICFLRGTCMRHRHNTYLCKKTIVYNPKINRIWCCHMWCGVLWCKICVNILCVFYRLTLVFFAVLRSQDLFPWKQGAGGEMATPPKWGKKLVLGLVSQVSPQMAFHNNCSPTERRSHNAEGCNNTWWCGWFRLAHTFLYSLLFVWFVVIQAAAVTAMKRLWVMRMRGIAPTSQHALLWLRFCPSSRSLKRGGPHKFSWKRQERWQNCVITLTELLTWCRMQVN